MKALMNQKKKALEALLNKEQLEVWQSLYCNVSGYGCHLIVNPIKCRWEVEHTKQNVDESCFALYTFIHRQELFDQLHEDYMLDEDNELDFGDWLPQHLVDNPDYDFMQRFDDRYHDWQCSLVMD